MRRANALAQPDRRAALREALAVAASLHGLGLGLWPAAARAAAPGPAAWEAAFQATKLDAALAALGVKLPEASEDVSLRVQDLAENGAAVPVEFGTRWLQARRVLLVVEKNPAVLCAAFELHPEWVEPRFGLRIKMDQTSAVRVIAMNDEGQARGTRHEVSVILGGCAAEAPDVASSQPSLVRARHKQGRTLVRVLMSHPMESGQRKDAEGKSIPAWHIREVDVRWQGQGVLQARWGPSVSRDPYLEFTLLQARVGDRIAVRWTDNRGESRRDEGVVEAG